MPGAPCPISGPGTRRYTDPVRRRFLILAILSLCLVPAGAWLGLGSPTSPGPLPREGLAGVVFTGEGWELRADRCTVDPRLAAADCHGVVVTTRGGLRAETSTARYDRDRGVIRSADPVRIDGAAWHLTGRGFELDVERDRLEVAGSTLRLLPG